MSFSRGQQGQFQPLKKRAWLAVCRQSGQAPKDAAAERAWYEAELFRACGKRSSAECDMKRDFEDAMAHFEAIEGAGIYWQLRRHGGDARRILHEIRQVAADFDCDEQYMQGIARQALKRPVLRDLRELTADDLIVILRALKIQVRRQEARGEATDAPHAMAREEDPF